MDRAWRKANVLCCFATTFTIHVLFLTLSVTSFSSTQTPTNGTQDLTFTFSNHDTYGNLQFSRTPPDNTAWKVSHGRLDDVHSTLDHPSGHYLKIASAGQAHLTISTLSNFSHPACMTFWRKISQGSQLEITVTSTSGDVTQVADIVGDFEEIWRKEEVSVVVSGELTEQIQIRGFRPTSSADVFIDNIIITRGPCKGSGTATDEKSTYQGHILHTELFTSTRAPTSPVSAVVSLKDSIFIKRNGMTSLGYAIFATPGATHSPPFDETQALIESAKLVQLPSTNPPETDEPMRKSTQSYGHKETKSSLSLASDTEQRTHFTVTPTASIISRVEFLSATKSTDLHNAAHVVNQSLHSSNNVIGTTTDLWTSLQTSFSTHTENIDPSNSHHKVDGSEGHGKFELTTTPPIDSSFTTSSETSEKIEEANSIVVKLIHPTSVEVQSHKLSTSVTGQAIHFTTEDSTQKHKTPLGPKSVNEVNLIIDSTPVTRRMQTGDSTTAFFMDKSGQAVSTHMLSPTKTSISEIPASGYTASDLSITLTQTPTPTSVAPTKMNKTDDMQALESKILKNTTPFIGNRTNTSMITVSVQPSLINNSNGSQPTTSSFTGSGQISLINNNSNGSQTYTNSSAGSGQTPLTDNTSSGASSTQNERQGWEIPAVIALSATVAALIVVILVAAVRLGCFRPPRQTRRATPEEQAKPVTYTNSQNSGQPVNPRKTMYDNRAFTPDNGYQTEPRSVYLLPQKRQPARADGNGLSWERQKSRYGNDMAGHEMIELDDIQVDDPREHPVEHDTRIERSSFPTYAGSVHSHVTEKESSYPGKYSKKVMKQSKNMRRVDIDEAHPNVMVDRLRPETHSTQTFGRSYTNLDNPGVKPQRGNALNKTKSDRDEHGESNETHFYMSDSTPSSPTPINGGFSTSEEEVNLGSRDTINRKANNYRNTKRTGFGTSVSNILGRKPRFDKSISFDESHYDRRRVGTTLLSGHSNTLEWPPVRKAMSDFVDSEEVNDSGQSFDGDHKGIGNYSGVFDLSVIGRSSTSNINLAHDMTENDGGQIVASPTTSTPKATSNISNTKSNLITQLGYSDAKDLFKYDRENHHDQMEQDAAIESSDVHTDSVDGNSQQSFSFLSEVASRILTRRELKRKQLFDETGLVGQMGRTLSSELSGEDEVVYSQISKDSLNKDDEELVFLNGHKPPDRSLPKLSVPSQGNQKESTDHVATNIKPTSTAHFSDSNTHHCSSDTHHLTVPPSLTRNTARRSSLPDTNDPPSPLMNISPAFRRRIVKSMSGAALDSSWLERDVDTPTSGTLKSWSDDFYDLVRLSDPVDDPEATKLFKRMVDERFEAVFGKKCPVIKLEGEEAIETGDIVHKIPRCLESHNSPRVVKRRAAASRSHKESNGSHHENILRPKDAETRVWNNVDNQRSVNSEENSNTSVDYAELETPSMRPSLATGTDGVDSGDETHPYEMDKINNTQYIQNTRTGSPGDSKYKNRGLARWEPFGDENSIPGALNSGIVNGDTNKPTFQSDKENSIFSKHHQQNIPICNPQQFVLPTTTSSADHSPVEPIYESIASLESEAESKDGENNCDSQLVAHEELTPNTKSEVVSSSLNCNNDIRTNPNKYSSPEILDTSSKQLNPRPDVRCNPPEKSDIGSTPQNIQAGIKQLALRSGLRMKAKPPAGTRHQIARNRSWTSPDTPENPEVPTDNRQENRSIAGATSQYSPGHTNHSPQAVKSKGNSIFSKSLTAPKQITLKRARKIPRDTLGNSRAGLSRNSNSSQVAQDRPRAQSVPNTATDSFWDDGLKSSGFKSTADNVMLEHTDSNGREPQAFSGNTFLPLAKPKSWPKISNDQTMTSDPEKIKCGRINYFDLKNEALDNLQISNV